MTSLGKEKIDAQNRKLSNKAKTAFSALGLLQEVVTKRSDHSTIFNIITYMRNNNCRRVSYIVLLMLCEAVCVLTVTERGTALNCRVFVYRHA